MTAGFQFYVLPDYLFHHRPLMHIVLYRPLIPQNTGSIARTCAATNTELHLIGPLGFKITEKAVKRAGLDYWPFVKLFEHDSFDSYLRDTKPEKIWFIETNGESNYSQVHYGPNDAIVFGQETKGIEPEILDRYGKEMILSIPIFCSGVRSLNLSNSVSIVLYEALRQNNFTV
jgi:tRNA (cytidine/uridine-2'-O-)-methyltransferase